MSVEKQHPPCDGSVPVLPGFLDFQAQHYPSDPWVVFPNPRVAGPGHTSLSFLDFSIASHRVAHILRPNREGQEGEVVAMVINCDSILYLALIAGMIRAGLVVRMSSNIQRPLAHNSHSRFPSPRGTPRKLLLA